LILQLTHINKINSKTNNHNFYFSGIILLVKCKQELQDRKRKPFEKKKEYHEKKEHSDIFERTNKGEIKW